MRKGLFTLPMLVFAGAAFAQEQPDFSELDADGDGMITQEEATQNPQVADRFDQLDINQDGQIDRAEYARAEGGQTEQG